MSHDGSNPKKKPGKLDFGWLVQRLPVAYGLWRGRNKKLTDRFAHYKYRPSQKLGNFMSSNG